MSIFERIYICKAKLREKDGLHELCMIYEFAINSDILSDSLKDGRHICIIMLTENISL